MTDVDQPERERPGKRVHFRLAQGLLLTAGLLAAVLVFDYSRESEEQVTRALFMRSCNFIVVGLKHAVESHLDSLYGLAGFFDAQARVEQKQFSLLATRLLSRHQAMRGLEWIPHVSGAMRAKFEQDGQALYGPDFRFTEKDAQGEMATAGARAYYFPVMYAEPLAGNRRALGFDLHSEPGRKGALEAARDSGQLVISPPVALLQEDGGQQGFLAMLPVYAGDMAEASLERRRAQLRGFCLAVLRYQDMVRHALDVPLPNGVTMRLFDQGPQGNKTLVYSQPDELDPPQAPPQLSYGDSIMLGGRSLRVEFASQAGYVESQRGLQPWWLALACLGVTMVLVLGLERIRRAMSQSAQYGRRLSVELARRETAEAEARSLARFTSEDPDPVLRVDQEGVIVYANQAATRLLDLWNTQVGGSLPQQWRLLAAQCLAGGTQQEAELPCGDRVYSLLLAPLPQAGYVNIYGRDITERRQAAESLRESEAKLRLFFDLLPDPLIVYDMQGKVLSLNAAFETTFGWGREEVLTGKINFVPNDSLPETMLAVERMKKGESIQALDTRRLTKDGRSLDIIINTVPIFDNGAQTGNIVTYHDITAVKATARALRESEQRYRALVETISEGLILCDEEYRLTFFNRRFCDMLGYGEDELKDRPLFELVEGANNEIMLRQRELQRQRKDGSYELAWTKKDGGRLFTLVSAKGIFDTWGHFKGSLSLITNITEQKILSGQLMQAQKLEAIGQLAAGIAHEINTPTQYVTDNTRFLSESLDGLLKLLARYAALAGQARQEGLFSQALGEIEELSEEIDLEYLVGELPASIAQTLEGLERIAKIVRSMKEFAHPGPETMTAADINKGIENTITVARNEWKYVAEVETDLDPELPAVPCVPGEINQVILNIIVNGAHAIADVLKPGQGEKGRIRVSTRQVEDQAEIRISDSGAGIPPAIQNRVFDPFFTTKEPGKGTGQGLAIAHTVIVDKHKGSLAFETQEGQGTTFIIRLPLKT